MSISVTKQLFDFLLAMLVGGLLGAVYDLFRISRLTFGGGRVGIFFQDLVFFLFCTIVTFLFLVVDNSGEIRAFLLVGELLGALLYFFTLGKLVLRTAERTVEPAKKAVHKAARAVREPSVRAARAFGRGLKRNGENVKKIWSNACKVFKIRLQGSKRMLYNQLKPIMHSRTKSAGRNKSEERKPRQLQIIEINQQQTPLLGLEKTDERKNRRHNAHAKEKKA